MIEARRIISTLAGRSSQDWGKGERDRRRRELRRKASWAGKKYLSDCRICGVLSSIHQTCPAAFAKRDAFVFLIAGACIGYFLLWAPCKILFAIWCDKLLLRHKFHILQKQRINLVKVYSLS